jgi:hypothetical protein
MVDDPFGSSDQRRLCLSSLLLSEGVFAMFEYSPSSQVTRSRVAAERYAVVSAARSAQAERKRVRVQARAARRARTAVAPVA